MISILLNAMHRSRTRRSQRGFTLIEIAIVIVVIGLLVGGGLTAINPVIQSARSNETREKMATIEAALLGYAISNGCLPCPATLASTTGISNDGADYATACASDGTCLGAANNAAGIIPWVTLNISENDATDAWGYRIRYGVDSTLTNASTDVQRTANGAFPSFTSVIAMENTTGTNQSYTSIAYVVLSTGLDGAFGRSQNGGTGADLYTQTGTDIGQDENGDNDLTFATGQLNNSSTASHYDDIVSFKSIQTLILSCGAGSCGNPS